MIFKSQILIIVLLCLLGAACSSPFDDRSQSHNSDMDLKIAAATSSQQCLSNMPETIKNYFDGNSSESEIGDFWDCTTDALKLFTTYVKGSQDSRYQPEELRTFLERYFLGKLKISDSLLKQAMYFKKAIVGGDENVLTRDEIMNAIELFKVLKEVSISMRGLQPITNTRYASVSFQELDDTMVVLNSAAQRVAQAVEKYSAGYSIDHIADLLVTLKDFLNQKNVVLTGIDDALEYVEPSRVLKVLLFHGTRNDITPSELSEIFKVGTQWYAMSLKFKQLNSQFENWTWGPGMRRFQSLIEESKNIFETSLKKWPNSSVPFEVLQDLIEKLGNDKIHKWFFDNVNVKTIQKTIPRFMQRIMGGAEFSTQGRYATGLTIKAVEHTWSEANRFFEAQTVLEDIFNAYYGEYQWTPLLPTNRQELVRAASKLKYKSPTKKDVFEDVLGMINRFQTLFYSDNLRLTFPKDLELRASVNFYNMYKMNLFRMFSRFVIAGYASDMNMARSYQGIRDYEFSGQYDPNDPGAYPSKAIHRGPYLDFYDLGVEMGYFQYIDEPLERKAAKKRFLEANLFSFAANGGEILDLDEMTQMFGVMGSGKELSNEMHKVIAASCYVKKYDRLNRPLIDRKCYLQQLFDESYKGYVHFFKQTMPAFVEYYESLDEIGKNNFQNLVDIVSRSNLTADFFTSDDTDTLATLIHYVESMFSKYDANNDGVLDEHEADQAYPVFKESLSSLSSFKSDFMLRLLFKYLLCYGEIPNADKLGGLAKFGWAKFKSVHADRSTVFKIFSAISTSEAISASN